MSEARISTALLINRFTMRMTGASLARSLRRSISSLVPSSSSLVTSSKMFSIEALLVPYRRSKAASISAGTPTRGNTGLPVSSRMALTA